jgi:hypothetical protein
MNLLKCILISVFLVNNVSTAAEMPEFRVTPHSNSVKGLQVSVVIVPQLNRRDDRDVIEVVVKVRAPINSRAFIPGKMRLELWGKREYIASVDIARTEVEQLPQNLTGDILKDDAVFYFMANKE